MTRREWFRTHQTVADFVDGEVVYLHVDGIGEVETRYILESGDLYEMDASFKTIHNYGSLKWWLLADEHKGVNNTVLCPPNLGD